MPANGNPINNLALSSFRHAIKQLMTDGQPEKQNTPQDADSRTSRRRRMLKEAYASFNEQFTTVPCIIRDMSETGAKLQFEDMWMVPDEFMLHVPLDGVQIRCKRTRSDGKLLGVRFLSAPVASNLRRRQIINPTHAGEGSGQSQPAKTGAEDDPPETPSETSAARHRRKTTFGRRR